MGASDSKLVFKQGIFKARQQHNIPPDDAYWAGFWSLPESVDDVFSLLGRADIRAIRDESLSNFETLILAVSSRLFALRANKSFPHPDVAPAGELLNCVRVLTRLLPYVYEEERLAAWEEQFFWSSRRAKRQPSSRRPDVLFEGDSTQQADGPETEGGSTSEERPPLAEELIDNLVELLYLTDFTVPKQPGKSNQIHMAIWQSGVGCRDSMGTSKEFENNRAEILRLLLTLASKSMYASANVLPVQGVHALTYMTTMPHKQMVLTLLCSLLNTTLNYNPSTWHVPYDHVVLKDPKQVYVTYCLQYLLALILYPVPEAENGIPPQNMFRHFLGKIHRSQDFQFLIDGMTRVLNQPLQATASYLPGSQKSLTWAPEMIMLFWEMLQCNKRFRSFVADTDRLPEFTVLLLFYALQHKQDASQTGIVRMCVFVLQTLSVEPSFCPKLNEAYHGQEALPPNVRIVDFRGSYLDYLIISVHALMTSGNSNLEAVHPALLAILNNVAPHAIEISSMASVKLMQLLALLSSTEFLFLNESNHELLRLLLEALNAVIEYQYEKNAMFIFAVLRSQKRFYDIRDLMVDGAQAHLEHRARRRKENAENAQYVSSPSRTSGDRSRNSTSMQRPALSNVPEINDTFTIGDDDEPEQGAQVGLSLAPSASASQEPSRAGSISSSVDEAVPSQLRSMSEKARGKRRAGHSTLSQHGSSTSLSALSLIPSAMSGVFEPTEAWVASWLPNLPLQTLLTLIEQLSPRLPPQRSSSTSGPALSIIRQTQLEGFSPAPMRIHLFEWSPLSLGWYESLLWGFIFASEATMFKGAAGIWKGTRVRLFRVQEAAAQGPSLMAPKGAVDAVGSSLVQRIGSFNLRSGMSQPSRNSAGGVVRDV